MPGPRDPRDMLSFWVGPRLFTATKRWGFASRDMFPMPVRAMFLTSLLLSSRIFGFRPAESSALGGRRLGFRV